VKHRMTKRRNRSGRRSRRPWLTAWPQRLDEIDDAFHRNPWIAR
jgi:hypothetical protein